MNNRLIKNTLVITAALGATFFALYKDTNWFLAKKEERERCYGIVFAGKNDCGTAKHACASQSIKDAATEEFIMVPKGLCQRIVGGKSAS